MHAAATEDRIAMRALNRILVPAALLGLGALALSVLDNGRREHAIAVQTARLEEVRNTIALLTAERTYLAAPERLEPAARKLGLGPIGPHNLRPARQPRRRD